MMVCEFACIVKKKKSKHNGYTCLWFKFNFSTFFPLPHIHIHVIIIIKLFNLYVSKDDYTDYKTYPSLTLT